MEMEEGTKYYLHRINREWQCADMLLEQGYLSIGWNGIDKDVLKYVRDNNSEKFDQAVIEYGNGVKLRARGNLWRFAEMKPGDYVVIPRVNRQFSIFRVDEFAIPVTKIALPENTRNKANKKVFVSNKGIIEEGRTEPVDIGFVIKGTIVADRKPRHYAKANLISRMKVRNTNVHIDDLQEEVHLAINSKEPVDIHAAVLDATRNDVLKVLREQTPDQMEKIVQWYMKRIGADIVEKPANHGSTKIDIADADTVAEFSNLNLKVCIQVKRHEGVTDSWAVEQISKYVECNSIKNEMNYLSWVISTADSFSEEAEHMAIDAGVRLINGLEFAEMILECGFSGFNNI